VSNYTGIVKHVIIP